MSEHFDRDPVLEVLFGEAHTSLPGEGFTIQVMARADRLRKRELVLRGFAAAVIAILAAPLQDLALPLTELLMTSLIEIDSGVLAMILAPINTVGTLLSLGFFGARSAKRKLFPV